MKDSDSEVKSFHVKPQQPPHQEENYYIIIQIHTGWVKKKWDLKKFQIALTHLILKLKSIVISLNQMSQSGEKHAQD